MMMTVEEIETYVLNRFSRKCEISPFITNSRELGSNNELRKESDDKLYFGSFNVCISANNFDGEGALTVKVPGSGSFIRLVRCVDGGTTTDAFRTNPVLFKAVTLDETTLFALDWVFVGYRITLL